MNRLLPALVVLLALLHSGAHAASSLPEVPPALDVFLQSETVQPVAHALPREVQRRFEEGQLSGVEERLGVPTFFWAPRAEPMRGTSLRQMGLTAEQAARRHLFDWGPLYGQPGAQLAESTLHRLHDTGRGAVIASFRKELFGIRVFRDELRVIMDRELNLIAFSGYLPSHDRAELRGEPLEFRLGHATAVAVALNDLTGRALEATNLEADGRVIEGYHAFELLGTDAQLDGLRFSQKARARAVWFTLPEGLVPAYYVELDVGHVKETSARMAGYVVSAHDGALLFRKDHTAHAPFTYRVWADADGLPWDGPQGTANSPHPTRAPDGTMPQLVAQNLITLPHGPISTNDPWLTLESTETRGNNVDAYADLAGPDGFGSGDVRPQLTAPFTFDFAYDFDEGPQANTSQISAAATMLFVANNFFHDWYYDAGFDEAAGNAQTNNFGRGGIAGDSLRVEAQDYSGSDNANMATPSDGARPRMQMFIFGGNPTQRVYMVSPQGSANGYGAGLASFGPQLFDVTAQAIRTQPTDACAPITNASALVGKIAVIDRGTCTFVDKAKAAQNAGAVGVIIANNTGGGAPGLSGSDPTIVIPTVGVSQNSGNTIKNATAQGPVTLRMLRQLNTGRDGTLDNQIVAHEWGHYISNRLIGDANGLNNTQGWGMGEGWGDFHALLITVREEDLTLPGGASWRGVYPMSTWVTTRTAGNGLYYGIRRLPFSIDFTRNALTFKHVQNGVPLPQGVPTAYGSSGNNNAEVHATGEVWAVTLWEAYAALLGDTPRLTFEEAQDRMKRYLVAGYKGTPNSPTFTEARDAILAAALGEDARDYQLMWQAFARRGMGLRAVSPNRTSTNNSPVTEDFEAGNALTVVRLELDDALVSCDEDGLLDNGEEGTLTVTVRNSGVGTLTGTAGAVSVETPGLTLPDGGALEFGDLPPFAVATRTVRVRLDGMVEEHELRFALELDSAELPQPLTRTVGFRGNVDEVPAVSATDDVEAVGTLWTVGQNTQFASVANFERVALGPTEHQWFGANPASPADVWMVSPSVDVSPLEDFVLTFRHRYDLEQSNGTFYDGAVLELQVGGNGAWMDIGTLASQPYDGALASQQSANPLRGRQAWSGRNPNYPDYDTVRVDLGRDYAGQIVRVRFRIGGDQAVAAYGWELDDIGFEGIIGTPFPRVVQQTDVCGNATPLVELPVDQVVDEGTEVSLQGVVSDDDGDPLTLAWTQVAGPDVALTEVAEGRARFTAPEVARDTVLGFELSASDGKVTARARHNVTVRNVNKPPVAEVMIQSGARAGDRVHVDGSNSSDPDGDALVAYTWIHVAGPRITFEGEGAHVSFVAPEVKERATVRLSLIVSDGEAESDPAVVELFIDPGPGVKAAQGCGCSAGGGGVGALVPFLLLGAALVLRRRRVA